MNIKLNLSYSKTIKNKIPNRNFFFKLIKYSLKEKKNIYFIININIVNEYVIKKINYKFRKINKPTNVLTFCKKFKIIKTLISDIVICNNIIEKESKYYNIKLYYHWSHIIVHSCLHILGFKHSSLKEFKIIKKKENRILNHFNINIFH